MSPTSSTPGPRFERLSVERGLEAAVRPPAYAAVLGSRMFVALADQRLRTLLFAAGPDGVPAALGAVETSTSGLCSLSDRLVLAGTRAGDGRHVAIEIGPDGRVLRETAVPVLGDVARSPKPARVGASTARVAWEERWTEGRARLAWADLSDGAFGPVRHHEWPDRSLDLETAGGDVDVLLLRASGHPLRSQLCRVGALQIETCSELPSNAVGIPERRANGCSVLLLPTPRALEIGLLDDTGVVGERIPVVDVERSSVIDGALLAGTEAGTWAVAVASSTESTEALASGEIARRHEFALVASDERTRRSGPLQPIAPPLALAWVEGRLLLWTGRAGAVVAAWHIVR